MSEQPPETGRTDRFVDDQRRYRLDSRIATGGMGEVWRATDTSLNRPVAVKVLKNEYADDPQFRARFETEARHAASLHHPNVASVYDVGESRLLGQADGSDVPRPFLVMELVDGQPLSSLLRGGRPLDPAVVRDLLAQAGDAIGAAHRAGIVHRDVKPANLLVTPDRQVKITDFGIARASDGLGLTGTGQVMGTPQYLSPEQARGTTATPASDVYALGVVAFECLAGRRPFDADSPVATALAHLNDPVPDLPPSVPADLAAVVRRALAKRPQDRFADGSALAAALRDPSAATAATQVVAPPLPVPDTERTQVMGAAPVGPAPTPLPVPPNLPPTLPPTGTQPLADERRSPWPIVLLVLALVAVVVLIVVLVTTGGDDREPTTGGGTTPSPTPPTTSAPTESSSAPSESTSAPPETFDIDEDDYVGKPLDAVVGALANRGLDPVPVAIDNPGDREAEEVASVSPTSDLSEGDEVRVEYYRAPEPPETSETPSETPSQTPSETPSQTPSESASTPSAQQTEPPGGSASPSADATGGA